MAVSGKRKLKAAHVLKFEGVCFMSIYDEIQFDGCMCCGTIIRAGDAEYCKNCEKSLKNNPDSELDEEE